MQSTKNFGRKERPSKLKHDFKLETAAKCSGKIHSQITNFIAVEGKSNSIFNLSSNMGFFITKMVLALYFHKNL